MSKSSISKQRNSFHSEEGNKYWLCFRMNESWKHIPSERNQTQKPHTVWFHWHEMSRIGKSVKQKTVDSMLPGDAKGISNLGWWRFLELVMVIAQSCAYIKNNCTFLQWFRWVLCKFYFKIFFKHLNSKFCSEW